MKTVLGILANDLKRRLRNPLSVILMLLIPVSMTLIVGVVFGPEGDVGMPEIEVLLVDNDGGFFGGFLKRALEQGDLGDMLEVTEVEAFDGAEMMEDGEASAMIVIPDSFSTDILDGRPVELRVVKNPSEFFLPVVVEEVVKTMAVLLDGATRVFNAPMSKMRSIIEAESWPEASDMQEVMDGAKGGLILAGPYVTDSLITFSDETEEPAPGEGGDASAAGFNIFAYVMPGSLMIGLLFIVELILRDLLRERRGGTLRRMLASPATAGQVVAGKVGAAFAVTLFSCVILLIVSGLGFGIDLGDPLALAVHVIAVILMCTGLMTFLYGAISNERAADAVMSVVIIVMALFGGSIVPIEQMPGALRAAGKLSPVYWSADGMKKIFLSGADLFDIYPHLLILFLIGILTMVPGTLLIRGRVLKGGE